MKKNETPPYVGILLVVSFLNIIFSTYFIAFFLIGVVFKIFLETLKKRYYYLLSFSIITFLMIEVVQGFHIFSLTLIALFLYYIIIPRIKHTFSSALVLEVIVIALFYLIVFVMVGLVAKFNLDVLYIFLTNFIIDIIIVGFFI